MWFGVLGPLQVAVGEQGAPIGSLMQRRLLALLLVHANEGVAADRIIDVLWAGKPPATAQSGLHTYVSRLRRALGDAGEAARLEACPPGYRLRVGPDELDASRFEQLVAEARADAAAVSTETAVRLRSALALWRGPAYAEFADEDFARGEAVRLDELRLAVSEDCFDTRLAAGEHAELVGELEAFVADHPFRERPRGQLMRALYASGRQPEALEAFQRFRERLGDELGLEPSPELRRLQADILRMEPSSPAAASQALAAAAPAAAEHSGGGAGEPEGRSFPPSEGNLPREMTSFVGRHHERAAVRRLLDRGPVVTLSGPGGVGKTRLALRAAVDVAPAYLDGVWLCQLAPMSGDAVEHAVAAVLGVQHRHEGGLVDALVDFLSERRLLLLLDNCEHVVDVAAALTERIARACPGITVLTTSRRPLGVHGEQVWSVPPLPLPAEGPVQDEPQAASVQLFCDRAGVHHPEFALTPENRAAVVEICRRLDGLPLAIELAAGLLHAMAPDEIAARLSRRLSLLTQGVRTDPRHRSLAAVVAWSYQLLDESERHLFDRLAVFSGSFDLAAAEAVCADQHVPRERVAGLLAALVSASMVGVDRASSATRYLLLETLRQYGLDRLTERGETADVRARHARHFVTLAEQADRGVRGPDEAAGVATLERELDNLRAAHRWAVDHQDTDLALRLVTGCYLFALYRLQEEVFAWAEEAAERLDIGDHPLSPAVQGVAAHGISHRGDLARTVELARCALDAAGHDDPARLPALLALAAASLYEGRLDDCREYTRQGVSLARRAGRPYEAVMCQLHEVLALAYQGRPEAALRAAADQRRLAEELDNPTQRGWARYVHAEALGDGDPQRALSLLDEAGALAEPVRSRFLTGVALVSATSLRARHGSPRQAGAAFREVIRHWHRVGDWIHQWTTLRSLVALLVRLRADEPAAVLLGAISTANTAAPLYGDDAARLTEAATTLRVRLGEEAFTMAGKRGASMPPAEVVGCALAAIEDLRASPA